MEGTAVLTEQEAGWAPDQVWTFWERGESLPVPEVEACSIV